MVPSTKSWASPATWASTSRTRHLGHAGTRTSAAAPVAMATMPSCSPMYISSSSTAAFKHRARPGVAMRAARALPVAESDDAAGHLPRLHGGERGIDLVEPDAPTDQGLGVEDARLDQPD